MALLRLPKVGLRLPKVGLKLPKVVSMVVSMVGLRMVVSMVGLLGLLFTILFLLKMI
jgi:hypothetical protein